ncbi:hypothetical protein L873DRAFT_1726002, partial [Choiromyces venosus 120613-1]
WPTLVILCGVSRSRLHLRIDSHWWLEHSGGEVEIVILTSHSKLARSMHVEKWKSLNMPNPRVT